MSSTPQYAAAPRLQVTQISTANSALDGTGTLGTVFTAGPDGSRIDMLTLKAAATTTAGMVRLFVDDGSGAKLVYEIQTVAGVPGGASPSFSYRMIYSDPDSILPLMLPAGSTLKASTQNAEAMNVLVMGGDF